MALKWMAGVDMVRRGCFLGVDVWIWREKMGFEEVRVATLGGKRLIPLGI